MQSVDSVFMSAKDILNNENKSLSLTEIIESIPKNHVKTPIQNWKNQYKTEWRWRIMRFNQKDKVSISYQSNTTATTERMYLNNSGDWVKKDIDPIYDDYVIDEYYYYSKK